MMRFSPSSQKIFAMQIFFGSPDELTDCFDCGGVCLSRRPRAQRAGAEGGAAALVSSAADLYQDDNIILWVLIRGYCGDDSYFAYAESFLNNMISYQCFSAVLQVCNLSKPLVLISWKAYKQLEFAGYERVDAVTWYLARKARNEQTLKKFLSSRCGVFVPNHYSRAYRA